MYPKIIIAGYKRFSELADSSLKKIEIPEWITVENSRLLLDVLLNNENKKENVQTLFEPATIVITGEQVAKYFKDRIDNFVIPIKIMGFNFLENIVENSLKEVTVVHFFKKSDEIEGIANILNVKIKQVSYENYEDVETIMKQLNREGVNTVIGGSFVCEIAERFGMKGIFYYSEEAMVNAINYAINILKAYRKEMQQSALFNTLASNNKLGIITTDQEFHITFVSESAEKLLKQDETQLVGKKISNLFPNLIEDNTNKVIDRVNEVLTYKNKQIVVNFSPAESKDGTFGSIVTIEDLTKIQSDELKLREKVIDRSLNAQYSFKDILGSSTIMKETIDTAKKYSLTSSTVLITGESGTGKELFAQSIHNESDRKHGPFVAINCAVLPESLLNSELFGYEEGAFTGAKKGGKQGLFELAHKGTIFLDEISEMPLHLQARLLRVLQEKEVMRLGGERQIPVDIRIITATNKRLELCVEENSFREDLYYRISVLQLYLPPLSSRIEDLKELLSLYPIEDTMPNKKTYNDIIKVLSNHNWPGNIREFENVLERFLVFCANEKNTDEEIIRFMKKAISPHPPADLFTESKNHQFDVKDMELELLKQALVETGGNKELAASKLGISRTTLWRRLNRYNL